MTQSLAEKERKRMQRNKRLKQNWEGYLYIAPWLIGFLLLSAWPMLYSLYLSFTDYSLFSEPNWVGIQNYKNIFTIDFTFDKSLLATFKFVVMSVPLKLVFALLVAMLLNKAVRGMSLYRTMVYLPSLLGGSVAVSVVWRNIFGLEGYVNTMLNALGIESIPWLSSTTWSMPTLVLLNVWQFGSSMIIFLAGLKQIPKSLYESARVDGAGSLKQFFHITLPMLSPVIFFNLINGMIGAFQQFNSAFLVSSGGPAHSTYVYALMLYEKAFTSYQMGYAAALAWILLVIIALFTAANFLFSKFWVFYDS
jgi:multiple sugar transport system permease protein